MTSERQRDLDPPPENGSRRPRPAADASPEVRLALLERDHHELEETVSTLAGTVTELCTRVGPVCDWATTQMEAAREQRRWWEGLVRDAIKHALGMILYFVATVILSVLTMAWANPQAAMDAFRWARHAMGGS